MFKAVIILCLAFFVVFGLPGKNAGGTRRTRFIIAAIFMATTGTVFYLMHMLKIAIAVWLILLAILYFWVYTAKRS